MAHPLADTQLEKWRAQGLAPAAVEGERVIRFVFRAVIGPDCDPDDIIQHGSEMLFTDYRDEGEDQDWSIYVPEDSYWEEE